MFNEMKGEHSGGN